MRQREFLRNLIESAGNHNEGAVTLLRQIMAGAADAAPPHSLLKMARFLEREIYDDAEHDATEQN